MWSSHVAPLGHPLASRNLLRMGYSARRYSFKRPSIQILLHWEKLLIYACTSNYLWQSDVHVLWCCSCSSTSQMWCRCSHLRSKSCSNVYLRSRNFG
uniref:Uncharacterized protein n=1 Tax=Rhizophora mucronata TaxID=61149 RepID=A0A2P2MCT8_RHIMU